MFKLIVQEEEPWNLMGKQGIDTCLNDSAKVNLCKVHKPRCDVFKL